MSDLVSPLDEKNLELGEHVEHATKLKATNAHLLDAAQLTLADQESAWAIAKRNPRMLCTLGAVLLNGIIGGIEVNMSGNMMGLQAFQREMGSYDASTGVASVPAWYVSVWTGFGAVPQLIGMFSSGAFGDRFGRRAVLYSILLLTVIGAVLEVTAHNWKMWGGAKAVMGLATGLMLAGVSTYIGEVAPRELRGVAMSAFNFLFNFGNLMSTLIAYGSQQEFPDVLDNRQWRTPLYVMCGLPAIIFIAEIIFLVESPAWLLLHNKPQLAYQSMRFLYPRLDEDGLEIELAKVQYTLEKEAELAEIDKNTRWVDCFRGVDLRRTFVGVFPGTMQPLAGNILYGPYATYFFSLAGEGNALTSTAIVLASALAANILISFVIDNKRIGRWWILFGGMAMMTVGMLVTGIIGTVYVDPEVSKSASSILVTFITIGAIGSVIGPGAAGWTYLVEAGSYRLRAKVATLSNMGNCLMMSASGIYAPYLISTTTYAKWGEKVGYFFGSFGLVGLVITWFFIPDLTGRSYAQIDELFERQIPARQFKSTVCTGEYGRDLLEKEDERH